MKLKLKIATIYGRERIFPACPVSELLIKLTARKTFYNSDITILEALGYVVEFVVISPEVV